MHLECVDIVAIYARIESCVHVVITEHSTSTIATTPHPKTAIQLPGGVPVLRRHFKRNWLARHVAYYTAGGG